MTAGANDLFITGMFRSGTTLASKILSSHPQVYSISDPFVYFFKGYRNFLFDRSGARDFDPESPISDWFRPQFDRALRSILDADLSEAVPDACRRRIIADIRRWKDWQHPELCKRLDAVHGTSFAALYTDLIRLGAATYGMRDTPHIGTKAGWSEEFIPALARAFPDMRFVIVLRDLRAVAASQNARIGEGKGKRPLLYYARQWRKSVAFIHLLPHLMPELKDRLHIIRYEDLVRDKETRIRRMVEFLGLESCPAMTDAETFRDEAGGGTWQANTSFKGGPGIFTSSLDKWKEILSRDEVDMLETLAGPELVLCGYETEIKPFEGRLNIKAEPPIEAVADWLIPAGYTDHITSPDRLRRESEAEALRSQALFAPQPPSPDMDIESFFINKEYFRTLRNACRKGADAPSCRPATGVLPSDRT